MSPNKNRQDTAASTCPQFTNLKPWRVCRLIRRFDDLESANGYAIAHGARFVHVMPEANGEASAWELEAHALPGVLFAVFREGAAA